MRSQVIWIQISIYFWCHTAPGDSHIVSVDCLWLKLTHIKSGFFYLFCGEQMTNICSVIVAQNRNVCMHHVRSLGDFVLFSHSLVRFVLPFFLIIIQKKKKLGSLICKLGNTLVSFFLLAYSLCMPNACAWFALVVSTEHSHACQNHSSVAY